MHPVDCDIITPCGYVILCGCVIPCGCVGMAGCHTLLHKCHHINISPYQHLTMSPSHHLTISIHCNVEATLLYLVLHETTLLLAHIA